MNKEFHITAPYVVLKSMNKEFQDFMLSDGYTIEQMQIDNDLPDLIDKDNLENDSLCKNSHSYKLKKTEDGKLKWENGSGLERIKGLCMDAHDFYKEKNYNMVKYCFSKICHYIIDVSGKTYPHNHIGKPWSLYHEKYETELGHFIIKHKDDLLKVEFKFTPCEDIYKYCSKSARELWQEGLDIVNKYQNNIKLTDEEKMEICKFCIQKIGDIWVTIVDALKMDMK